MSSGDGTQHRHTPELLKDKIRTRVTMVPEGTFRSNTFEMQNRIRSKHQNSAKKKSKTSARLSHTKNAK